MMFLLRRKSKICDNFYATFCKGCLSFFEILYFLSHFFLLFLSMYFFFNSSHPYIFFNKDGVSMTFVGFHIDQDGNLIDPDRCSIIQHKLMSRHLRTGLCIQKVDMETNYESWSKYERYYIYLFDIIFVILLYQVSYHVFSCTMIG